MIVFPIYEPPVLIFLYMLSPSPKLMGKMLEDGDWFVRWEMADVRPLGSGVRGKESLGALRMYILTVLLT